MTEKHTPSSGELWALAGVGSALLAGHLMVDSMARLHRAGRPARLLLGAAPFAFAGWMLSQWSSRAPRAAPTPAPDRKRVANATDAEVVAPAKPRLVEKAMVSEPASKPKPALAPTVAEIVATVRASEAPVSEPEPESKPKRVLAPTVAEIVAAVRASQAPVSEPEPVEPAARAPLEPPVADTPLETAKAVAPEPEPAFVAERPTALAAARVGGADDLTLIKGIGPKLAAQLNDLGYFHFDQIAAWSEAEMALVDAALEGVPGRPTRNDWIGQAALLARPGVH